MHLPGVVVITGAMAAGKSTVADALARRLTPAAHIRGDAFRKMIVSGRAPMDPPLGAVALAQLRLRHHLAASTADGYVAAGITAVMQDLYLGEDLPRLLAMLTSRPVHLVVLAPDPAVLAERDRRRGKTGYDGWDPAAFDAALRRDTPRLGLWLDTSTWTVEQTVDRILDDLSTARVDMPGR